MKKLIGILLTLATTANLIGQNIQDITLTKDIFLRDMYTKEYGLTIDSVTVRGFVNEDNINFLRYCTLYGRLRGMDLSECTFEDNALPERAFFTPYANSAPKKVYNNEELYDEDDWQDKHGGFIARMKYIKLPQGLERIGSLAFAMSHLNMLELPNTVKDFTWDIVETCPWLKVIKVSYRTLEELTENSGFFQIPDTVTLMVPKGTKEMYEQDVRWNKFKTIVEYDDLSGISDVKSDTKSATGKIYTLNGICVGSDFDALSPGIYIANGKKIVK